MTNVEIRSGVASTRGGVVVHRLAGAQDWDELPFKGATFFNPTKGFSQRTFGDDKSMIVFRAGGRTFKFQPDPQDPERGFSVIEEITQGNRSDPEAHLSWAYPAENYCILQDGESDTFIYDGETNTSQLSPGYNSNNKPESRLANGATAGAYGYGRIVQVVNGRQVLIGDIIHKTDRSDSENILEMTEQTYFETGAFLSPPSNLGAIMAIEILPEQNTLHGTGDLMLHCYDGVFALDLSQAPRSSWVERPLVRHVLLHTAATGPYAIALYDGDQIFRSRHGIQTLRSAAAETQLLGNPNHPISEEVDTWIDADHVPFLRFASLEKWAYRRRAYCTTQIKCEGPFWFARGALALNFAPLSSAQNRAWEGLITMPPEVGDIIQFVNGMFNGKDRLFAFCSKDQGDGTRKIQIVEFVERQTDSVIVDGERKQRRISSQVISREYHDDTLYTEKEFLKASIFFRNVKGVLDWGVWARTNSSERWAEWMTGRAAPDARKCFELEAPFECNAMPEVDIPEGSSKAKRLAETTPRDIEIALGSPPEHQKKGRRIQFLVRWKGIAQLEGIRLTHTVADSGADRDAGQIDETICRSSRIAADYNDFEYCHDDNRWEDGIQ